MQPQTTLIDFLPEDSKIEELQVNTKPQKPLESVVIVSDFNVAWKDGDWYLRKDTSVELDSELANILVGRGLASFLQKQRNARGDRKE